VGVPQAGDQHVPPSPQTAAPVAEASTAPDRQASTAPDPKALAAVRRWRSIRPDSVVPPPVRIEIPSINVRSKLQRLGRDAEGAIEIPSRWQAEGVRPGQPGPAVILGHVDSKEGPAIFYRLREMRRGDTIEVTHEDGSITTFVVDRLEQHAKTRFPTDDVYLPTLEPTLRLVTCDGVFDRSTGHYRDNLVVFANLRD
jgi:sortase (surface protein transpeptidase)